MYDPEHPTVNPNVALEEKNRFRIFADGIVAARPAFEPRFERRIPGKRSWTKVFLYGRSKTLPHEN
jgi:hypothetical protein